MATKTIGAKLRSTNSERSDRVEDLPDEITHYTDLAGLLGIIEKKELWLSNAAFLNDREELNHGIKQAKTVLANLLKRSDEPVAKGRRGLLTKIATDLDGFKPPEAYITCFCVESDLLSQWRGYGSRQGVSITFDTKVLVEMLAPTGAQLHRVHYGTTAARRQLRTQIGDAFPDLIDDFDYMMGDLPDDKIRTKFEELMTALVPRFKHYGFREEDEWRLVVMDPDDIKFRPRNQIMLPYVVLKSPAPAKLPITNITIGPGVQDEAVSKSIGFFLSHHGYEATLVATSRTPYRS